jgi:dienelactone hydrolase
MIMTRTRVLLLAFTLTVPIPAHSQPQALLDEELAKNGQNARNNVQLRLLETDELSDALTGLALLRARPDVDTRNIAVAGHSFGGSLTLLVAERDSNLMAAVDFAGVAAGWESSPQLCARLLTAVGATVVPIFFIHAANDYSIAPGKKLTCGRVNKMRRRSRR